MYGLIHSALQDMVKASFGEESWRNILDEAGVAQDHFIRMQPYDDDVTYRLIFATSAVLDTPVDQCLELFGRYWIGTVAQESYGSLMESTGRDIVTFIRNVNVLHDRITSTFPHYVPPEFYLAELGEGSYRLTYVSTRKSLAPFVRGLLYGLGERFDRELVISSVESEPCDEGETWNFILQIGDT